MRARVMAWAEPERFVTLTLAPDEWQALRQKVRKLKLTLGKAGYPTEWAWTVEQGKRTGMRHVHCLQHGRYIPQRTLADAWGARVDIRRIGQASGAGVYAMKEALRVAGYAMKGGHDAMLAHLERNGGRGCHLSRGYLRGKTTAEVEALLRPTDPDLSWVLVPMGKGLSHALA